MEVVKRLTSFRIARFTVVGLANTAVNFTVLNLMFYELHANKILSSIVATCCAVVFSFALNRSYVFRSKDKTLKRFARFSVVAASGTLAIQTSIYSLCVWLLHGYASSDFVIINFSNLIASIGVMLWNYNGYRLFVFNGNSARTKRDENSKATSDTIEIA